MVVLIYPAQVTANTCLQNQAKKKTTTTTTTTNKGQKRQEKENEIKGKRTVI